MFGLETTTPAWKARTAEQRKAAATLARLEQEDDIDVVIIGAGVAGASAAYHLLQLPNPPKKIVIVDHGDVGVGSQDRFVAPKERGNNNDNKSLSQEKNANKESLNSRDDLGEESVYHPGMSGGVIFSAPHFSNGPTCLKMVVQLYPSTTKDFIHTHGRRGARHYLRLAARGIELERQIARAVITDPRELRRALEEEGSLMVCEQDQVAELEEEYRLLRELGCDDVEWWDERRVRAVHGKEAKFVRGIFFPKDCRVDALTLVRAIVAASAQRAKAAGAGSSLVVVPQCPTVHRVVDGVRRARAGKAGGEAGAAGGAAVAEREHVAETWFVNGACLRAKHAVLATNGLFFNGGALAGLLVPCWSYFATIPHGRDPLRPGAGAQALPFRNNMGGFSSINFFTYGFTHDWCVTDGVLRISGEDHNSALRPPRAAERSHALAAWLHEKYPYTRALTPGAEDTGAGAGAGGGAAATTSAAGVCPVSGKSGSSSACPFAAAAGNSGGVGSSGSSSGGAGAGSKPGVPAWMQGRFVYGVYGETPDTLPLVGMLPLDPSSPAAAAAAAAATPTATGKGAPQSRVCYLLGCNAWGQASMSLAASLVPALLGYRGFESRAEAEHAHLLAVARFKTQQWYHPPCAAPSASASDATSAPPFKSNL